MEFRLVLDQVWLASVLVSVAAVTAAVAAVAAALATAAVAALLAAVAALAAIAAALAVLAATLAASAAAAAHLFYHHLRPMHRRSDCPKLHSFAQLSVELRQLPELLHHADCARNWSAPDSDLL